MKWMSSWTSLINFDIDIQIDPRDIPLDRLSLSSPWKSHPENVIGPIKYNLFMTTLLQLTVV